MNSLSNKVQLIGNLGADPEIVELTNGSKVAKLSLATTVRYKNKQGEQVTNTQWHKVVAYNAVAGIIEQYVKKGNKIGVEGKLNNRSWEDKEGIRRYMTEIVVNDLLLLGDKS
ncbi:MAG: single-stranded DNA-binding protein [Nonlabens sp.]